MPRYITVGGAQLGPISRHDTREQVIRRLIDLLREAKDHQCELVVFPELALTAFFPHWYMDDQAEIDKYFEKEMPSIATKPLFAEVERLGIGFYLGYAELAEDIGRIHRYNTSILVNASGQLVGKYRKIHLPGHQEHRPTQPRQGLEKRYFEVGNLGFNTWRTMGGVLGMCVCNDRRWPETFRVLALRGAEMVLLGYNSPTHTPWEPIYDDLTAFHHMLCLQAGAYLNSMWIVAVAKAGLEEGVDLLGKSAIVAPSGEVVALSLSKSDELIVARCDLDLCAPNRRSLLNFDAHRRPEHYRLIGEQTGFCGPA